MTDEQTPMTPEERQIAVRGWTRYCQRGVNTQDHVVMCRRLRGTKP